ncbi:MAG: UDP-N-acetylglucosamine pyrophosphorylase, partial [Clostridia bacterium]|nr:UDP-N-acetylglucosamine pyrophosphorylase [Clostridia bacterium]
MYKTKDLFDLSHSLAAPLLEKTEYPWEALDGIKDYILALGPTLPKDEYDEIAPHVWVAKDAQVYPSAYLGAPCIIGHKTEVRHCAFIRGSALIGDGAVVGNSVEIKNAILFDGVQVPHFNYVGDSVMG